MADADQQQLAQMVQALSVQQTVNALMCKVNKAAFSKCTSDSFSDGELSRRQQTCVKDYAKAYIAARNAIGNGGQ